MSYAKANPDYYRLSRLNRMLALSGAPVKELSKPSNVDKLRYKPIHYGPPDETPISITPQKQSEYIESIIGSSDNLGGSLCLAIGSHPSENASVDLAILLSRMYYECRLQHEGLPEYNWINLSRPDWNFLRSESKSSSFTVISGLSDTSEIKRIEIAKDFIKKPIGTVLYTIHTPNSLKYSLEKLGITPDAVIQLGNNTINRKMIV